MGVAGGTAPANLTEKQRYAAFVSPSRQPAVGVVVGGFIALSADLPRQPTN
jgi:hypothetical protein